MKSRIFLFDLDHRSASLSVRETLALTGDGLRLALKYLREKKEADARELEDGQPEERND